MLIRWAYTKNSGYANVIFQSNEISFSWFYFYEIRRICTVDSARHVGVTLDDILISDQLALRQSSGARLKSEISALHELAQEFGPGPQAEIASPAQLDQVVEKTDTARPEHQEQQQEP